MKRGPQSNETRRFEGEAFVDGAGSLAPTRTLARRRAGCVPAPQVGVMTLEGSTALSSTTRRFR